MTTGRQFDRVRRLSWSCEIKFFSGGFCVLVIKETATLVGPVNLVREDGVDCQKS